MSRVSDVQKEVNKRPHVAHLTQRMLDDLMVSKHNRCWLCGFPFGELQPIVDTDIEDHVRGLLCKECYKTVQELQHHYLILTANKDYHNAYAPDLFTM